MSIIFEGEKEHQQKNNNYDKLCIILSFKVQYTITCIEKQTNKQTKTKQVSSYDKIRMTRRQNTINIDRRFWLTAHGYLPQSEYSNLHERKYWLYWLSDWHSERGLNKGEKRGKNNNPSVEQITWYIKKKENKKNK